LQKIFAKIFYIKGGYMKKFKRTDRHRISGFSLIEVIITITIIAILSIISGPIYRSYSDKATMAEGYALLGTIRAAQEAYREDTGTFLHGDNSSSKKWLVETCNDEVLGIDARHNKYYTSFRCGSNWSAGGIVYTGDCVNKFVAIAVGPTNLTMAYNTTSGVSML
jgi:prepilin-type N-terminal cleavage/methylation domain-containing protein